MMIKLNISPQESSENARDFSYRVLKENILNLTLEPGGPISENTASQILGISRTPIRNAFSQLAEENLLISNPQLTTYVSYLSSKRLTDSIFMWRVLEIASIKESFKTSFDEDTLFEVQASLNHIEFLAQHDRVVNFSEWNANFSKLIFQGCNLKSVYNTLDYVSSDLYRIESLNASNKKYINEVIRLNKNLLFAIETKDEYLTEKLINQRFDGVLEMAKEAQEKYPQYFGGE